MSASTRSDLIHEIARVELRVLDVDEALGFYRDVVGLDVLERGGTRAVLGPRGGPAILVLDSNGVTGPAERNATGLFHTAIRFPDKPSLGDALARLVAARYEIGAGDHGVSEALYIDDPSRNGVELYYDRSVDQWPRPADGELVGMTTGPVDLQGLLAAGRDANAVGQQAPEGTDIGHVHLQVSDVERTVRFYVEELGLDLMQRFGGQAAFLSSNGYHHHIGANTWNSRGASPARKDRAGIERIVFTVASEDRLEHLRLRLAEYGRDVSGEEGASLVVSDPDAVELRFELAA